MTAKPESSGTNAVMSSGLPGGAVSMIWCWKSVALYVPAGLITTGGFGPGSGFDRRVDRVVGVRRSG